MNQCLRRKCGAVAFLFLCACSSAQDDLNRYIHDVKSRPPRPRTIEPIPEFKPLAKFAFPADDKRRSPFKPIVPVGQVDVNMPNFNRPKQPLEAFPLDALKFVGTLKEGTAVWALINQPGGLVVRVRVGDYMGKNFGQILKITDNKILIEETAQLNGRWEKKRLNIDLSSHD